MNIQGILVTVTALTLSACGGSGSTRAGIDVDVIGIAQGSAPHEPEAGAAQSGHSEIKRFRRGDGLRIDLQLGLLNLVPMELQPCNALARWLERLSPLASAYAHGGGDGEAPEGALDVIEEDGTAFGLGEVPTAPGTYCGIVVEIRPGARTPSKHGGELDAGMSGTLINVAPCYYPGTESLSDEEAAAASVHHCLQAKVKTAARRVILPFAEPVTLDGGNRHLGITVVSHYEAWFEGIDFDVLATDAVAQALLLDNAAASLEALTGDGLPVALRF